SSSEPRARAGAQCVGFALAVGIASCALLFATQRTPPLGAAPPSSDRSFAEQRGPFVLPTGKESVVHPSGRDVPEAVEAFLDEAGTHWLIVWDRSLDTPLFAAPAKPFSAIEPSATLSEGEQASVAARAFVA